MDKVFAEIFSKEPYKIIGGDYFYYNPYYDDISDEEKKQYEEKAENLLGLENPVYVPSVFKVNWEQRSHDDFSPFMIWSKELEMKNNGTYKFKMIEYKLAEIKEIFSKIAAESKPFIDISSSVSWGLVPCIAKMNPKIPCIVTDIQSFDIKSYRKYINRNMTEYNINLASFDNYDMPIKDNALDYVTSTGAISSSLDGIHTSTFGREKVINEVYRILKPGGCYVTVESSGWHDQFIAAGFQAEIEYNHIYTFYVLRKSI